MRLLFFLFVLTPLVELYLLFALSERIGFLGTLGVTLVTGALGSALAKREGLRAFKSWRRSLDSFSIPDTGLTESVMILVGGVLLITPGVLTDLVGFALLVPTSRRPIATWVRSRLLSRIEVKRTQASWHAQHRSSASAEIVETSGETLGGESTARIRES